MNGSLRYADWPHGSLGNMDAFPVLVPRTEPRLLNPLAAVAGLLMGQLAPSASLLLWVLTACVVAAFPAPFRPLRRSLFVLLLFFGAGATRAMLATGGPSVLPHDVIAGSVSDVRPTSWTVCRMPRECVIVSAPVNQEVEAHVGDRIWVKGAQTLPRSPANPFDFDERTAALSRGARSYIRHPERIVVHHAEESTAGGIAHALVRARQRVMARMDNVMLTQRSRSLLRALLLGDRSTLDPSRRKAFERSGLVHVLAVSGLHTGIVAMLLLVAIRIPLRRLRMPEPRRRAWTALCTAAGLLGFVAWVGASPSVVRAAAMGCWMLAAYGWARPYAPETALAWAACASLFHYPSAWQTAGFSLSYAAVGGILLFARQLSAMRRHPVRSSLIVTGAATLGTAPVLLYHMGSVPLSGAILSPLVIPLMIPVMLAGLIALSTSSVLPVVVAEGCLFLLDTAAQWGASWPGWTHLHATPTKVDPWIFTPWLLLFIATASGIRQRTRRLTISALCCAGLTLTGPFSTFPSYVQLDVGQGDAAVIVLNDGPVIVIDSGPSRASGASVVRHVRAAGRHRIDLLIHSHEHADHTAGTPFILEEIPVRRLIRQHQVSRGDTIHAGPPNRLFILGPSPGQRGRNDQSIILRLQAGTRSILFTGDAERQGESLAAEWMGPMMQTDVVKVPHHGSLTSSNPALIQATRPRMAVISVGRMNRYGHPDSTVVTAWKRTGARVHITAVSGAYISDR